MGYFVLVNTTEMEREGRNLTDPHSHSPQLFRQKHDKQNRPPHADVGET